MANNLVPAGLMVFEAKWALDSYLHRFLIPVDTLVAAPVAHVSGAFPMNPGTPAALAVTSDDLALCNDEGIVWSQAILDIGQVEQAEFPNLTIPITTKGGRVIKSTPRVPVGIRVTATLTHSGATDELKVYTQNRQMADGWVTIIRAAMRGADARLGGDPRFTTFFDA